MSIAISHHTTSSVPYTTATQQIFNKTIARLRQSSNLFLPLSDTIDLLEQLTQFSLGRFLLHNRGLNGYWTSYIFRNKKPSEEFSELEAWLLHNSLYVMARERFYVFQQEIMKKMRSNMTMASIPCGLMDDFLLLDYSAYKNIKLMGIDADIESLELAKENALQQGYEDLVQFVQKDAWILNIHNAFDLIASNGLNMYESSEKRLIDLYRNFYLALKSKGTLITSFIPPPPANIEIYFSSEDFLKERAIFGDIIQANYLNFCTEETMKKQLQISGFSIESIIYNSVGMAPVIVAKKK